MARKKIVQVGQNFSHMTGKRTFDATPFLSFLTKCWLDVLHSYTLYSMCKYGDTLPISDNYQLQYVVKSVYPDEKM